jgi:hypothetical protein
MDLTSHILGMNYWNRHKFPRFHGDCWSLFGHLLGFCVVQQILFGRAYCLLTATGPCSHECWNGWVWWSKRGLLKPYASSPPTALIGQIFSFSCNRQILLFTTTSASPEPEPLTLKMETVGPSEMSEHWSASWCRNLTEDPSLYPMFICGSCFTGTLAKTPAAWRIAAVALSCQPTATQNRTPLLPATANPPTYPPVAGVAAVKWILQRADSINSVSGHSTRHITCCTKS